MTLEQIQSLTDDEIRVKVAELCGWSNVRPNPIKGHVPLAGTAKDGPVSDSSNPLLGIPNYTADLNACHEAIHTVGISTRREVAELLSAWNGTMGGCFSTARQRCNALLATMPP